MYRSVHTCVHVHSQLYEYVFTYLRARARERESERERGRARAVWLVWEHAVMIHSVACGDDTQKLRTTTEWTG